MTCFFSFQSFAQDPDSQIYNTWYLSEMIVDIGESIYVTDIFPPISPTLIINENLSFTGESACNAYMGDFMFHVPGDFFNVHNFDTTLSLCDYDSHNDFETQFYSYFWVNADVLYYVGGLGDEQYLILEFAVGYELIFQNVPVDLSVNDIDFALFTISPNPVIEKLFISSVNIVIESLSIYSLTGKKVAEEVNKTNSIDVSTLSKGMYFIEISSATGKSVKKFIKK